MTFAVQELNNPAVMNPLIAFQELSAHEVSHRRHHAEGMEEPEMMTRFRDSVKQGKNPDSIQR